MRKEEITKPDGRYIIYYSFDEDEPADEDASDYASQADPPEVRE